MSCNAWMIRPSPHNKYRLNEFKEKNIIAIGWPHIGNLSGKSKEDIKAILSGKPYEYSGRSLGYAEAIVDIVVNQMDIGDYVLIPDGDDIYFAVIDSDYQYDLSVDNDEDGYPHQRLIKNFTSKISRDDLSDGLRNSLKSRGTSAKLSHHYEEIKTLAEGGTYSSKIKEIPVTYQLRPDYVMKLSIPENMTKNEAERLSLFVKSLYYKE